MSENHPIRLVMFTSDDCLYCPPIEKITLEVIGQGMGSFVHVHTIDVKATPEAAARYNIVHLPTLMINEEIVLQGGMDDDSVRDLLWDTIMAHAVQSKELIDQSKQSLLYLTMNFWDSLNGSKQLRQTIGDFIHLAPFQLTLLSLYSLDPLVPVLLYRAGQQLGIIGMLHHILNLLEPRLGKTSKTQKKFRYLADSFELYYSDRELLRTNFAENAKIQEVTDKKIVLNIWGLASSSIGINIGEPLCDFTAGQLAGITTAIMGTRSKCIETQCQAMGEEYCSFEIQLLAPNESDERQLPSYEDKVDKAERREYFYEVIHELTLKHEDSLFFRKLLRERTDFIHISALQPIVVSLKLMDEFTGSILYSSGRELGIFGPGKGLLQKIVQRKNVVAPVDFNTGVTLLHEYLSHPASSLAREWGEIRLLEPDSEDSLTRVIAIEEYGAISGIKDLGKTFCDYLAGYIAGRLQILIGMEPFVKEIACQGTGSPDCRFKITIDD